MKRAFFLACLLCAGLRGAGVAPELPLIEVAADKSPADAPLVVFLSGDGGWAEFVAEISHRLTIRGWPVVGFNLRKYLSTPRTPEETAAAVEAVITRYAAKWNRHRVILAGFSRGADIAPFIYNRLPASRQAHVDLVIMLSPGPRAEFEFHFADFLRKPSAEAQRSVAEEIVQLKDESILILHGEKDDEALVLPASPGRIIKLPGDHHLGHDYTTIVKLIAAAEDGARKKRAAAEAGVR